MYHLMTMEPVHEAGTVAVRFTIEGRSSVLGAADVDTLIEKLVELRAGMSPAHSMTPVPSHNYPLEVDPSCTWTARRFSMAPCSCCATPAWAGRRMHCLRGAFASSSTRLKCNPLQPHSPPTP